ncbi:hypothetical protein AAVH_36818 [Aphelenchoides avenae]|nr:hypothetical protein AAVH_36818 [Aphelenchus avenae]
MPVCTDTCPAAVWIGLYRDAGGPFTGLKWSDGTPLGLTDYKNWGLLRPYFETFSTKTYVSIYGDPMDTPELWGKTFYGKWDHFKWELARMRAGVCKRDY